MNNIITRAEISYTQRAEDQKWEVRVVGSGALLFITDTTSKIDAQLQAYSVGLMAGMDAGRAAMQTEIREALGLV